MKNLANCKPSEFLKQTNKIRKSVEKWLTLTDIINIRKRLPRLTAIDKNMSKEEKDRIFIENKAATEEQARKNMKAILDAVLDEHPDETLEILALICFVDPKDVDSHSVSEYLEGFTEIMNDSAVLDFFTSLVRLAQINTSSSQKA